MWAVVCKLCVTADAGKCNPAKVTGEQPLVSVLFIDPLANAVSVMLALCIKYFHRI